MPQVQTEAAKNSDAARAERLAFVARSPEAANARDREGWLSLYASDAVVADPVGTPVCRKDHDTRGKGGHDLGRFYDMFIGGMSALAVDVKRDVVVGDVVVRDVVLRPTMAFGHRSAIPTHLLYELKEENGGFVVAKLGAHWDASQATKRGLATGGWRAKASMMVSTARMIRVLGRDWMNRYLAGTKGGIRRPGRESAAAFVQALRENDAEGLAALCTDDAVAELPLSEPTPIASLLDAGIAIRLQDPIASGWVVSAGCTGTVGGREVDGLVFLEFDQGARRIARARFFWE